MKFPEENQSPATNDNDFEPESKVAWLPLTKIQRRVAGVLIEKSKTTPDVYPMTINAIKTASNQKSNRAPQMQLCEDEVEETLHELRQMEAVIEVHASGRVPKFKHQLYEWLGVEKVELAVMSELLLRGEQSLGDLRARASRMDKINGINELRPILDRLIQKKLVVELTPPGRGQMVTHNLYQENELRQLKAKFSGSTTDTNRARGEDSDPEMRNSAQPLLDRRIEDLQAEIAELRDKIGYLETQLADIQSLLK